MKKDASYQNNRDAVVVFLLLILVQKCLLFQYQRQLFNLLVHNRFDYTSGG